MQRLSVNSGVVLIMGMLSDLLKKAPQSIKDKYKIKIREKAIERVKEKIMLEVLIIIEVVGLIWYLSNQ